MRAGRFDVLILVVVAACADAPIDGDDGYRNRSFDMDEKEADEDNGEQPAPDRSVDASARDAGGADALLPSNWCAESDLALCFMFEGNAADQAAAHLTPAVMSNIAFVPGRDGQAALFGTSSAIRFNPHAALELAGSATIEAWVRWQNTGANGIVIDDDGRFALTITAAGQVKCNSSTGNPVTSPATIPVGQWTHVACVIEPDGVMRPFIAGAVSGTGRGSIASRPTTGAAIGGNFPSGEPFLGAIDSLRVFRFARTPDQIAAAAAAQ